MELLQDEWPTVFHTDDGCGTIAGAQSVLSRSVRIAACFLELEKVNRDLESKLRDDFNSILNSMDKLSLSPISPSPSLPLNRPTRSVSSIHNSSFTIAAYSWLLENIANPYPSSMVKELLAQQHNCLLSTVNTWFVNARRRIGWTALCRDYFNNCRADALDAAYRALIDEDPDRPLRPDVIHAFVSLKTTVEGLYSSTSSKSALTADLDIVINDMTETFLVGGHRHREPKEVVKSPGALEGEPQNEKLVAQPYYVSPDCSCSSSPVPPLVESLTSDSEEEDVLPPVLAGRKRRLSCSDSHTPPLSSRKRSKYTCPTSCPSVETYLPSSEPCKQNSRSALVPHNPVDTTSRLSDATGRPGHPQELTAEPCLHTVSDPVPHSTLESEHSIDEWFHSNFDDLFALPPPADIIAPDQYTQWEVGLFSNYSIPSVEPQEQPFKLLNAPTGDQASTLMSSLELDSLVQPFEGGTFVTPSEKDPTVVSVADPSVPQGLSSSESIDWTALLDWPTFEPSPEPIFDQYFTDLLPLPEIDLSILQLPQPYPYFFNQVSTGTAY